MLFSSLIQNGGLIYELKIYFFGYYQHSKNMFDLHSTIEIFFCIYFILTRIWTKVLFYKMNKWMNDFIFKWNLTNTEIITTRNEHRQNINDNMIYSFI